MQKLKRIYILLLSVILILGCSFSSYADLRDLMIATGSNALMTLDLNDDDYSIIPYSSIASISNTVDYSSVRLYVGLVDEESGMWDYVYPRVDDNGEYRYYVPSGKTAMITGFVLYKNALPSSGTYKMQLDVSSDVSLDYSGVNLRSYKYSNNVQTQSYTQNITPYTQFNSGDVYTSLIVKLGNISEIQYLSYLTADSPVTSGGVISGLVKVNFSVSSADPDYNSAGAGNETQDYQNDVSSSLSDLSSSVDEVSDEIGFVAEAIQNLQGAMEPHYNNVLTQLHHITEQLHAFYDQIYNNIHLKEYALWQDIKTAIENIDLEVNVNLDKLKTSIDNMSQAIQNKLQNVTDTITGGYDNSGIEQNGNALDSSINEYEEAEQNVLESVNDSLNDFEFEADMSEYKNIVQVISDFLQELYDSSGGFKLVINLSLMLSVASIVIGVYRFKEGG